MEDAQTRRTRIEVTQEDDGATVVLSGEWDLRHADELTVTLRRAAMPDGGLLRLDLRPATFVDSTVLAVLVELQEDLAARGGRVRTTCVPGPVLRVLEMSGLAEALGVRPVS